jgi:hypothetical protein
MARLKAQSAIEYLMTYGWMLLVAAIVGGAMFSLFQDQELESQTVQGFDNSQVRVQEISSANSSLGAEIVSRSPDEVEEANLCIYNESFSECKEVDSVLDVGESEVLEFSKFDESSDTNRYQVNISYRAGSSILQTEEGSATIKAEYTGSLDEKVTAASAETSENDSDEEVDQTLLETVEQFSTYE